MANTIWPTCWRDPIRIHWIYRVLIAVGEFGGAIGLGVLPFLLPSDPKEQKWYIVGAVACAVLSFICLILMEFLNHFGSPWRRSVLRILEQLGAELWQSNPDKLEGGEHEHRVTLFQLQKRWFALRWWSRFFGGHNWTHRLVPRARAPRSGRRPRRVFRVNDQDGDHCEGIAGLAFCRGQKSLIQRNLPDLHPRNGQPGEMMPVSDEAYKEYAKRTNDSIAIVKSEKYSARVIGGVAVYVNGERWGVLLIDSRDADPVQDAVFTSSKSGRRLLNLLSAVLEN